MQRGRHYSKARQQPYCSIHTCNVDILAWVRGKAWQEAWQAQPAALALRPVMVVSQTWNYLSTFKKMNSYKKPNFQLFIEKNQKFWPHWAHIPSCLKQSSCYFWTEHMASEWPLSPPPLHPPPPSPSFTVPAWPLWTLQFAPSDRLLTFGNSKGRGKNAKR